jgi:hypothetical protein
MKRTMNAIDMTVTVVSNKPETLKDEFKKLVAIKLAVMASKERNNGMSIIL